MVDILPAPSSPATANTAAAATGSNVTAVQVAITSVTSALDALTRSIQTNATPITEVRANALTLVTALGNISVALPQNIGTAEKQNLTQQLMNLMQAQKPLTLALQPGSPPTQGTLFVPTAPVAVTATLSAPQPTAPLPPLPPLQPLQVGHTLPAIVLTAPSAENPALPLPATPPVQAAAQPAMPQSSAITEHQGTEQQLPLQATVTSTALPGTDGASVPVGKPSAPPPEIPVYQQQATPLKNASPYEIAKQISAGTVPPRATVPTPTLTQVQTTVVPPASLLAQSVDIVQQQPRPLQSPYQNTPLPVTPRGLQAPQQQVTAQETTTPLQQPSVPPLPAVQTSAVTAKPLTLPLPQNVSVSQPIAATPAQQSSLPAQIVLPQPSTQVAAILKPGTEVSLRIDSIIQQAVQAPPKGLPQIQTTPLPTPAPHQIMAVVSSTAPDGQLVLKNNDTTFFVKTPVKATVGSIVLLSVEAVKDTPPQTLPEQQAPVLQELTKNFAALAQSNAPLFHKILANHIPQPNDALPGALLLLFNAFKQGGTRSWLGSEATDALVTDGKAAIIASLNKELSSAGQPVNEPVIGHWRSYDIPIYVQQQFQSVTLYTHSDREARKQKVAGYGKIRFLIDMKLSKLGAMQIDGFVQPKKLDMILRSETALPEGLHHELRGSYIKAMEAVGFAGTLSFQVGRKNWMVMNQSKTQGILT